MIRGSSKLPKYVSARPPQVPGWWRTMIRERGMTFALPSLERPSSGTPPSLPRAPGGGTMQIGHCAGSCTHRWNRSSGLENNGNTALITRGRYDYMTTSTGGVKRDTGGERCRAHSAVQLYDIRWIRARLD